MTSLTASPALAPEGESAVALAARRRAERIRLLTSTISENVGKLRELVHEAKAAEDIAPIVGVHHDTVAQDIKDSSPVGNPTTAAHAAPVADWRDWTPEDLQSARLVRYQEAAVQTAAAKAFDESASLLLDSMRVSGVATLGSLFVAGAA